MRLREVVFQGVFGLQRPARVRIDPGFCNLNLPPGARPEDFQDIILSLLYPRYVGDVQLRLLGDNDGADLRLGLVIEADDVYKLQRRVDDASVSMQRLGEGGRGQVIAEGADEVEAELMRCLKLPSYEQFLRLNCWQIPEVDPQADDKPKPKKVAGNHPPEVQRLLDMYVGAQAIEALDLERDSVEADLSEAKRKNKRLNKLFKRDRNRRQRIEQLENVLQLPEEERDLLLNYQKIQRAQDDKIDGLHQEIAAAQEQQDAHRPGPLARQYPFVVPLVLSVGVFIASLVLGIRLIALLNVGLLGAVAWAGLKRYDDMERVSVYGIRVEQVHRRIDQLKEEKVTTEHRYKSLLARLELEEGRQLAELDEELEELRRNVEKGEDKELAQKTAESDALVARLQKDREALDERRQELGDIHLPTYEIESHLARLGVDTYTVLASVKNDPMSGAEAMSVDARVYKEPLDIFDEYQSLATELKLFRSGRLSKRTRAAWSKMLVHVMGKRWSDVQLLDPGKLMIGDDALPADLERLLVSDRGRLRLVAGLLASGIIASLPAETPYCRFLCLTDPYRSLDPAQSKRLDKILAYMGKELHVLVLEQRDESTLAGV